MYGLPANMLAIPLMGFCVMPMAVAGLLLTPFGADAWAWKIAGLGAEAPARSSGATAMHHVRSEGVLDTLKPPGWRHGRR